MEIPGNLQCGCPCSVPILKPSHYSAGLGKLAMKKFLVNHKHFPVNGLLIIAMMFTLITNTFGLPYMAAR